MPTTTPPRREDGAPSNWDRYLDLLARRGVPEKMRLWYVRRVEEFLKALRPKSLSLLTAEQITGYLQEVSSGSRLTVQYSIRTEQAYLDWCHRFLAFCGEKPAEQLASNQGQTTASRTNQRNRGLSLRYPHELEAEISRLAKNRGFWGAASHFALLDLIHVTDL